MLVAGLAALSSAAGAQSYHLTGVGGKIGFMTPENLDGTGTVGAHLEFERGGSQLHLLPNVMYWKSNSVSDVNPNMDLYYHFASEGAVSPYLGAGVGMNFENDHDRSRNNLGANLFGGFRFPTPARTGFLEGRYTASDRSQFALLGGMTFNMH